MLIKSRTDVTQELIIGKTFMSVEGLNQDSEDITFKVSDTEYFKMQHYQDCCENVYVEDVVGNVDNLLNSPILGYEEKVQEDENASESGTYTFYTFRTIKGYVDIRWYGESNGYYSEAVDFEQCVIEDYPEDCLISGARVWQEYEKGKELCMEAKQWRKVGDKSYNSYYKLDDIISLNLKMGNK